jgi:small subunit ribosomal protein S17e
MNLGNVRPEKVKKFARELLNKYPDKFTTDFEKNKQIITSLAKIPTTKLRNNIAGYITRLTAQLQQKKLLETES